MKKTRPSESASVTFPSDTPPPGNAPPNDAKKLPETHTVSFTGLPSAPDGKAKKYKNTRKGKSDPRARPISVMYPDFFDVQEKFSDAHIHQHLQYCPINPKKEFMTMFPAGLSSTDVPNSSRIATRQYSLHNVVGVPTIVSSYMPIPTGKVPEYILNSLSPEARAQLIAKKAKEWEEIGKNVEGEFEDEEDGEQEAVLAPEPKSEKSSVSSSRKARSTVTVASMSHEPKSFKSSTSMYRSTTPSESKKTSSHPTSQSRSRRSSPPLPQLRSRRSSPPLPQPRSRRSSPPLPQSRSRRSSPPPSQSRSRLTSSPPSRSRRSSPSPPSKSSRPAKIRSSKPPRKRASPPPRPRRKVKREPSPSASSTSTSGSGSYSYEGSSSSAEEEDDAGLCFEFRPVSPCGAEVTLIIEPNDDEDPLEYAVNNGISPIICCTMPPCYVANQDRCSPYPGGAIGIDPNFYC